MQSEALQRPHFRFFVFTCRDPATDFRLPFVEALRQQHETYYIWLKRRPVVSGPGISDPAVEMSAPGLLRFILRFRRDDRINVYFNSTNTYFPGFSVILRLIATAGIWCFDMHDDLRYHNEGLKRWTEGRIIALLHRLSHVTVHAAPTLQELIPDSHHLGNASNIMPLSLDDNPNSGVLVIASFDERFDFEFMSNLALACPAERFHMHGWTRPDDSATKAKIAAIDARHDNIQYHGPYTMLDLPGILQRYKVSVAPYRTNTTLTRYIDPLRFYHCLNAGLEVVSTDIPQACYLQRWVHVAPNVEACIDILTAIRAGRSAKQASFSPITWQQKAKRLLDILQELPRTLKLERQ